MKSIVLGKGQGKTSKLIELCAENWGYIVCSDPYFVADMARNMGKDIPFPMTYDEFLEGRYHAKGIKQVYIDDVDSMLYRICCVPIVAITMTKEEN